MLLQHLRKHQICFRIFCAEISWFGWRKIGKKDSEKQAVRPPLAGRGRGRLGGTGLARVDVAGASSSQTSLSQTGLSQTVDPTQYQQHYQEQAYQPEYQEGCQPQHQEGYQPHCEKQIVWPASSATTIWATSSTTCRVWSGGWGWRCGLSRGPYELSLLPNFGKHVACKLWNDKIVSIICLI